jgi:hypothetical protein
MMFPSLPRTISILILAICFAGARAQQVDSLYLRNIYNRCLDFDETKSDSLLYYANYIREQSEKIKLITGSVLAMRLVAIHAEMG